MMLPPPFKVTSKPFVDLILTVNLTHGQILLQLIRLFLVKDHQSRHGIHSR